MKEIESLYESVLNEKYEHEAKYHDKEDIVPLVKDTGPEAADNVNLKIVDTEELSDKEEKDNAYKPAKFSQKSGKVKKESINNSVMENENIFDKLYKTVMEGDEFDHFDDGDLDTGDDFDTGEDLGGEEEPSVTVQLSPTHVEALLDLLAQVEDQVGEDEGEDIEDFEDDDEDEDALVAEGLGSWVDNFFGSAKSKAKKLAKVALAAGGGAATLVLLKKNPKLWGSVTKLAADIGKGAEATAKGVIKLTRGGVDAVGRVKDVADAEFPKGEATEMEEVDYDESLLNPKGKNTVGNVKPKGGKAQSSSGKSKAAPDGVAKHAGNKGSQKVTDLTWG